MEFSRQEYCSGLPFPPPGEAPGYGGGAGDAGGDAALVRGAKRQEPEPRGHGECRGPAVREEGEAQPCRPRGEGTGAGPEVAPDFG